MWEIVGIVTGAVMALIAAMTYFETRRDKKLDKQIKQEKEERKNFKEEVKTEVLETMEKKRDACFNDILEDYVPKDYYDKHHQELMNSLENHYIESIEGERERLASEIINFAEDIKNNIPKSSVAYEHIHLCYKRYKSVNGNSYIDEVFKYVIASMSEKDE